MTAPPTDAKPDPAARGSAPRRGGPAAPTHWAERAALEHLRARGWRHLASNYRLRGGELDLVFEAGATVVVVEVKQRKSAAFGHPAQSIDGRKLSRLRATAQHYASYELRRPHAALRLDAVLIVGTEQRFALTHLEDVG